MGVGGAPEGVISAAALRCIGGNFQGQLVFHKEEPKERAKAMGIDDPDRIYKIDELARGNVMFCATGVTDGSMLRGVQYRAGGATTHSMVMRSETKTLRFIEAHHDFHKKPGFGG